MPRDCSGMRAAHCRVSAEAGNIVRVSDLRTGKHIIILQRCAWERGLRGLTEGWEGFLIRPQHMESRNGPYFWKKEKSCRKTDLWGSYPSPRCEKGHFFLFLKCRTFLLQQLLKAPQRFTLRQPSSVFLNCPRKVPWSEIF